MLIKLLSVVLSVDTSRYITCNSEYAARPKLEIYDGRIHMETIGDGLVRLTLSKRTSGSNYELQSSGAVLLTVRGSHTNGAGLVTLFEAASQNGGPLFKRGSLARSPRNFKHHYKLATHHST